MADGNKRAEGEIIEQFTKLITDGAANKATALDSILLITKIISLVSFKMNKQRFMNTQK